MPTSESRLESIPIRNGHSDRTSAPSRLGNFLPLLHELRHALSQLQASGTTTTIDLAAMPFGPGDREALLAFLGQGEVEASVEALGKTQVRESRFPGLWLISYFAPDGAEIGLQLEITQMPRLLVTPEDDIRDGLKAFDVLLKDFAATATPLL